MSSLQTGVVRDGFMEEEAERGHLNHMQVTWITVFTLVYVESVLPKDPVGEVTFPDLY